MPTPSSTEHHAPTAPRDAGAVLRDPAVDAGEGDRPGRRVRPRRALVVALLMAVMVISVLDKSIFAFAGPQIIDELALSPEQFGFVGSAFFFLYSVSGLLVGFLANRWPARWILSGMSLVWMLAQLATAAAGGFSALVASRMLLGAGCGPGTAVTQHACFKWYAPRERVVPAAMIQVAIMLGAVAGALSLPLLIQKLGWRNAYLILAGVGLAWLLLWQVFGREGAEGDAVDHGPARIPDGHGDRAPRVHQGDPANATAPAPTPTPAPAQEQEQEQEQASAASAVPASYRRLLLNRSFVVVTLAGFCSYLPTALIYSWVPVYLQRGLGLTPTQSGLMVMVATVGVILLNLIVSSLSQRALQRGVSVRAAMVAPPMLACVLSGVALAAIGFTARPLAATLALFVVGSMLVNLLPAFSNSIVAFIAPEARRASMLAIHIGLMTSAGMLAPHGVGVAVAHFGGDIARGFELALGGFGLALIAAGVIGWRFIDPERSRRATSG
ncbi:MFS transporter [Roseateles chitosanitabidus]|uniref:MFS transporter n=1 Tax=Roseateles chitosanitabidus TaxID=65048 RepID=UPI002354B336|nr:MFS transporter [Roseateles chitosanitabidus]